MKNLVIMAVLAAAVAMSGTAQAIIVAYEPFDYNPTDASIDGSHLETENPDWVHKWGVHQVLNTGLTYGSLPVRGASVRKDVYGDPVINTARKHPDYYNTAMASDIAAAGLLADGATLWASILINTPSSITNSGAYFTIGTHHINFGGNARTLTTYVNENADAVGLKISNTTFQSARWQNQNAGTYGNLQAMPAGTHLYVMEMVWGATTDTINYYLPGTDLTLGDAIGSINVSVDNANFVAVSLSNINGDSYIFDEIRFGASYEDVIGVDPYKPYPADGAIIPVANPLTLSWTNPYPSEPNAPVYDVYFGTDPAALALVLDGGANATWVNVDASAATTYYWQIDVAIGDANAITGDLYSFTTTSDVPPTVVIDTPAMMTYSDNPVLLDTTITDDAQSALTITWTATPDGVGDPNLVVDFVATYEDPVVTVTNLTGALQVITMTVTVEDAGNPGVIDQASVQIDVYPNACRMAINGEGIPVARTDFNVDCVTDLSDFAVMAASWLDDYSSTVALPK